MHTNSRKSIIQTKAAGMYCTSCIYLCVHTQPGSAGNSK